MALKLIGEPFLRAMFDIDDEADKAFDYAKVQSQVMLLLVGYLAGEDNPVNNAKLAGDAMDFIMKHNLLKEGLDKYFRIDDMYYALAFPCVQDLKSIQTTTGRGGGSHLTELFDSYTTVRKSERGELSGVMCDECFDRLKHQPPDQCRITCCHHEFQTSKIVTRSLESNFIYIDYPCVKNKNNKVRYS